MIAGTFVLKAVTGPNNDRVVKLIILQLNDFYQLLP